VKAIAFVLATILFSAAADPPARRVLFIGNSLTSVNDVPGLVEALSIAGRRRIVCKTVAFGGYSLEDHWNRGDAQRAIAEGGWSIVVLQQGPSSLPESRALLVDYVRRFSQESKRIGATTALYMVWPAAERSADFDGVRTSYADAARAVGGIFLPAGEAWRAAWKWNAQLELYGADGFHPTPLGSYLAALVIYQRLSGKSPIGMPSTLRPSGGSPIVVAPVVAAHLQQIAAETNARQ
jgi:hypothetical protein